MKLYWRFKKGGKWTWRAANQTPSGKPIPFKLKEEEE
jgi:hypothetical protein